MTRSLSASAFAACAFVFVSCGGDDSASGPAGFIPADTPIYIEASVEPGEQTDNAKALLERLGEVPLLGSVVDPETLIQQALDAAAAETGSDVSYAEDIEPWLGDRFGFGVRDIDTATGEAEAIVALEVSDAAIAKESVGQLVEESGAALEDVTLGGVEGQRPPGEEGAFAFVGDFLVFGTSDEAFEAAVGDADSLADADEYSEALDGLPGERLASAVLDFGYFLEVAAAEDENIETEQLEAVLGDLLESPIGLTLTARDDALVLDSSGPNYPLARFLSASELLEQAPAESIAALGTDDLGEQAVALVEAYEASGDLLESDLEEFEEMLGAPLGEVAAAFGDAAVSVGGELPDEVVAEIELATNDREAAANVVEYIRTEAEKVPANRVGPPLSGSDEGFSVVDQSPGAEIGFGNIELEEDRISMQFATDKEVLSAAPQEGSLADNEVYQRSVEALGDDFEPAGFADLRPILDAALAGSSLLDAALGTVPPEQAVLSFLADKLGFVAFGEKAGDDRVVQRLVIGLAE